jgi:predicted SPOUT superfamily RNA methylase MTH1
LKIPVITIESEEAQFTIRQIGQKQVKEQTGYADVGEKHPIKIKFNLPPSRDVAFPVGQYTIAPSSYQVGKYGGLELNPFELDLQKLVTPADIKTKAA